MLGLMFWVWEQAMSGQKEAGQDDVSQGMTVFFSSL